MPLETVLLAIGPDDTDRLGSLAETTADVAGPAGADVVLAHVFDRENYEDIRERLDIDPDSETTPDDVASRHRTVREVDRTLHERGVGPDVRGALGEEGESIVRVAREVDADLVVVGGRKRSPTGKAIFGSTAQEVMLNAPCPVTFVRD